MTSSAGRDAHAPARRGLLAIAVLAVVGAAAAGVGARATYGARVTADEPQYLLSAISITEDGDLDIADELAAERWRDFHEADLPVQAAELPDGRRISPHDPLLPLLLAPGVMVGDLGGAAWLGAKLVLVVLAGALAAVTWRLAVHRLGVDQTTATVGVVVFGGSLPLAAYGSQVYPEVPAALAVAITAGLILAPTSRRSVVAVCALVVALPWLAVKYAPVAAALGGVAVVRWTREGRWGAVVGAAATAAAAALVWVVVHRAVWTGLTAYASADLFAERGEFSAVGFAPDLLGRSRRLIGLLVGRDFGLAAWQPAWLLLVPAITALAVRRPRGWAVLAVPLAVGWLVATFVALTMQGWWVPGRQVVVILPLAVVAVCWWVSTSPRRGALLASLGGLGALGVAAWIRLAMEASTGRLTLVVDFFETGDPVLAVWRSLLPAYLRMDPAQWLRHGLWMAAGVIAVGWVVLRRQASAPSTPVSGAGRT